MIDLTPATLALANLVRGIDDLQLVAPTPCPDIDLGGLLDHVNGFSFVFAAAGTKTRLEDSQAPAPDASNLGPDWRVRIPRRLTALAEAWVPESAWVGTTSAGGQDLPAQLAGVIALDEVIVHSWDIAVSSGQSYFCDVDLIDAALGFVRPTVAQSPDGTPGLFGPPVEIPGNAPALDRLLGLTGRDPGWLP